VITDIATIFLVIIGLVGFAKVYLDWSGFERRVHQTNLVDSSETRKVAIKIVATSAIAGLALSLAIIVVRLSSPSSANEEEISGVLYVAYAILCTVAWPLLALLILELKVVALRSAHKEKPPE